MGSYDTPNSDDCNTFFGRFELSKDELAKTLRAVMDSRKMNVPDVHRATGVSLTTIKRILATQGAADLDTLDALAKGLGIAAHLLISPSFNLPLTYFNQDR